MEYINEKKSVIIIHPSKPQAVPEGCFTSEPLPLLEFINDTTRAVINLLANGTPEKYPNVKVLVPHCGSFLPNIIDRLSGITRLFEQKEIGKAVDVQKGLSSLSTLTLREMPSRGESKSFSLLRMTITSCLAETSRIHRFR
ncbi:MAG: hypothetical protein V8R80_08490 [Eubacterium sp.]